MRILIKGSGNSCRWKVVVYLILVIVFFIPGLTATAQGTKKDKSTDWIGPLAGINVVFFYPKDVNENPIDGGDPEILPRGMFGLSYYHAFTPRWAHLFQLRVSDHQIKYWMATKETDYHQGNFLTVESDSGDYHLKYKVVSMNYMFGWCLNKQVGWHLYTGFKVNHTIVNQSIKVVDRTVFGTVTSNIFTPYPQPIIYEDEKSKTYAPHYNGEVMVRTDVRIKLGDQWKVRPVLEYGIDPGNVYNSVKEGLAFYIEIYKAI